MHINHPPAPAGRPPRSGLQGVGPACACRRELGAAGRDQPPPCLPCRPSPAPRLAPIFRCLLSFAWAVGTGHGPSPPGKTSVCSVHRPAIRGQDLLPPSVIHSQQSRADLRPSWTPAPERRIYRLDPRHAPCAARAAEVAGVRHPACCPRPRGPHPGLPSARDGKQRFSGERPGEGGARGCAHRRKPHATEEHAIFG